MVLRGDHNRIPGSTLMEVSRLSKRMMLPMDDHGVIVVSAVSDHRSAGGVEDAVSA